MMKILCLSFRTPPLVRPQSILIGKMISEWIRQGVSPVVLTHDDNGDWYIDIPIYKIPAGPINTPTNLRMLGYVPVVNKVVNKLVRLWRERQYFRNLFKVAGEIIKKHDIDIIFSFSNPQESNILGAMLKKKLGVPFVSHFSDPWVDNPYKTFSGPALWKAKLQEKFVVKNSDGIVFTNEPALELVMKKYPDEWKRRAMVIPHCYDQNDYPRKSGNVIRENPRTNQQKSALVFSYIGVFYKQRNPELFFKALKTTFDKQPELKQKIVLKLVGIGSDYTGYSIENVKKMLVDYGLAEIAELVPFVEYRESLKCMVESDCLLVIDADMKGSPFLPSKAVDYAGSGTPILGITPSGSPTDKLLEKLGYPSFNYGELAGLTECVEDLLSGAKQLSPRQEALNEYHVSSTTAKLLGKFRVLLEQNERKF